MTTVAPPPRIFSGTYVPGPLGLATRVLSAFFSLCCLAVLMTAAWLTPDPSGVGTHRQLGLAPCALLDRYGIPCPACGMTTSFTYLVHGHPIDSARTQPAGTVLCGLTAAAFWACAYVAITGRPGAALMRRIDFTLPLLGLLTIVLLGWAYKIVIVVHQARGSSV